jgi:hypothetical protein
MQDKVCFLSTFRDFAKERADLEREYAKKLDTLSKRYLPRKYNPLQEISDNSVHKTWERLLLQCLEDSNHHEVN